MSKIPINDTVSIDLPTLIDTRLLVQANSGGGKSWLLRRLLEQSHGKVQQIVIDLEGEFSTLREKYDYILAAKEGDTAAEPRSAALLAKRLLELNVSAIIDLYELSHQERKHFVRLFLSAMVNAPKSLWHPCLIIIDEAHVFCLDTDTEVLTSSGWRRHDAVNIGDKVITFKPETGTYHEEAVEQKIYKPYAGDMVRFQSDGIDSIVTPDHRVVLRKEQRAVGRRKMYDWSVCLADKVPHHVYIPKGGAPDGDGVDISNDILTAMGWIITDGCLRSDGAINITQAPITTKRGLNIVGLMDAVLKGLGSRGRYARTRKRGVRPDGRTLIETQAVDYYLGADLSHRILAYMDSGVHRIPRAILEHANMEQFLVLYEALLQGDGTAIKDEWHTFFAGYNEGLADDFQELATRLGISTVKKKVPQNGQWIVGISRRGHHYIRRTGRTYYEGIVWCITVPSGAFVARRNGKVFVTGNCPQVGQSEAMESVIDIATRGRKRGYCAVLATQRLSKLHKDAVAEMNNKLIGRTGLDIDRKRAAEELGFTTKEDAVSLRNLAPGEFYAFGPAISEAVEKVTVGPVETSHPKAGARIITKVTPPTAKIRNIMAKLADLPQEAREEAQSLEMLKSENTSLKRRITQLEKQPTAAPIPAPVVVTSTKPNENLVNALRRIRVIADKEINQSGLNYVGEPSVIKVEPVGQSAMPEKKPIVGGALRMLQVLASRYPMTFTKPQLALLANMSPKSGTYGTYLSLLKSQGLIEGTVDISLTEAGVKYGGGLDFTPQTQEQVLDMWRNNLTGGARRMFDVLVDAYPGQIDKAELGERTEMSSNSGTFGTYLSLLRRNGLVEVEGISIKASPNLFVTDAFNQAKETR